MAKGWTVEDTPDQTGKTILVTGANSGLGYETALALAGKGARVLIACRDLAKGREAEARIRAAHPRATVTVLALDLASLDDVRRAADAVHGETTRLDVLVNNAGVMALPYRKTRDGFEMQLGTNHLGPFALTGLVLDLLLATPGARIVTVSSGFHRLAEIRFDDPQWERGYSKWPAYGQSKVANLLFAYELQRRLAAAHAGAISVAAHPGYAATNLQFAGPRMEGSSMAERFSAIGNRLFAQSAAMGALPQLYAATAPDVRGGDYFGPSRIGELWGAPRKVVSNAHSNDATAAGRLWTLSEQLTGVRYGALASA
jgi:NAD(P)-dependent dehydrogenase (short-subunit alcohol dehydrogenase family)